MTARGVGVGYGRANVPFRESPKLSRSAKRCQAVSFYADLSISKHVTTWHKGFIGRQSRQAESFLKGTSHV